MYSHFFASKALNAVLLFTQMLLAGCASVEKAPMQVKVALSEEDFRIFDSCLAELTDKKPRLFFLRAELQTRRHPLTS